MERSSGEPNDSRVVPEVPELARAVRRSTAWLAALLDLTEDAISVLDATTMRRLWANRAMVRLSGYSREELLSVHAGPLQAPDADELRRALQPLVDGAEESLTLPGELRTKAGGTVPVEAVVSYRKGPAGEDFFVSSLRDVSDRLAADRRQEASEARFRAAFEAAPLGLALLLADGRVASANSALAGTLGRPTADLEGRPLGVFVPLPREPDPSEVDIPYTRPDGDALVLSYRATLLPAAGPDAPGEQPTTLAFLSDVTGQRRAQATRDLRGAMAAAGNGIRDSVLAGRPVAETLDLICRGALDLLQGSVATISTPGHPAPPPAARSAQVEAVKGSRDADAVLGSRFPIAGSVVEHTWRTGRTRVVDARTDPQVTQHPGVPGQELGVTVTAPLRDGSELTGVLSVTRSGDAGFTPDEVELVTAFAAQAAGALEVGRLRADRERLHLLEDRERIAHDLHETVVQGLFGTSMLLHSTLAMTTDDAVAHRLTEAIEAIDGAIDRMRSVVFGIGGKERETAVGDRLERLATDRAPELGLRPVVTCRVPDDLLPRPMVGDLVQVVDEALTNVARHAAARNVEIRLISTALGGWTLEVQDDGVGFDVHDVGDGNGLAALRTRAELLGATLEIRSAPGRGTTVRLDGIVPGGGHL